MARSTRSAQLETRSSRLNLPIAKKPVFVRVGPRIGLGYRRNQTVGSWVARVADGRGGNWTKAIGAADDFENADGTNVLDFWQAQEKARALARDDRGADSGRPATIGEALDGYATDLKMRGADTYNAERVRTHLPPGLRDKPVALLATRDLRRWRDRLLSDGFARSSVNRISTAFKAALNLAAEQDERIASRRAWETGLASIPDATQSRNVIIDEAAVRWIIAEAYGQSTEFGIFVEVAAVTGARVSQLARLEVQDLQADRANPRLMMPSSKKGRGVKKILRRPVPIPVGLAVKLEALSKTKTATAPLLVRPTGEPWHRSDHGPRFHRAAKAAQLDPGEVTIYALRHSNIVRQILAGVPIRVVAVNHDTSVAMIERTYSRYIGDHSDQLARGVLLDTSAPPGGNVVPMRASGTID
jgi:integrase